MNLFIEVHHEILKMLIDAKVDFIIISGYSVIFHGYRRTTGDIDIWLKPDNDNKNMLLRVLKQFGFDETETADVASLDFSEHMVISIGDTPEKIDFLTRINLVKVDDADKKKIIAEADGLLVPFLHIEDLILSKMNTGRPKEQADIAILQQIANARYKL